MVIALLDNQADVNAECNNNLTPLRIAAKSGMHISKLLLDYGTDVNIPDEDTLIPPISAYSGDCRNTAEGSLDQGSCKTFEHT